jgi:hypothetical protein
MNHGIIIIGDALESRIWRMAMNQGQFVAVYTEKFVSELERHRATPKVLELWESTYVPPAGESLLVNPMPIDLRSVDSPVYEWASQKEPDYLEYARYEPQFDQQFWDMCNENNKHRHLAIVVPSITGDEEAMRLLHVLHSLVWPLGERYSDLYGKRKKSERRLRDVLMPIRLEEAWVYCMGVVGTGFTNIFLSKDPVDEGMIDEMNADKYEPVVIEKW